MCRALVCSIVALLAGAGTAHASELRRIVPSVTSFASDGTRYVAWEVPGQKPIFVLDTRTGHRLAFHVRCSLRDKAPAAAGRFLLACGGEEEQALFNVRTGTATVLPIGPPILVGEYGPLWEGVGSRYVIGKGGTPGRCAKRHQNEACIALYNIATRVVTEVAESQVPDPDHAGAPPLCRALGGRVLKASTIQAFEGLGPLTPLEAAYYSYSDGLLAEPEGFVQEREPRLTRDLVLIPCDGTRTLVYVRVERQNFEPFLRPELSGGVLTWSTGHPADAYEYELRAGPGEGDLRHGILGSYNTRTHQRQIWALPPLRFHVTKFLAGEPETNAVGTFGYSAHTEYDAFWIAARTASCTAGESGCDLEHEVLSIYAAHL